MRWMGKGVQKADRDRLHTGLYHLIRRTADRLLIKGCHGSAVCGHSLGYRKPQAARYQRCGTGGVQIVVREPLLVAHFKDVPKSLTGQQCSLCPFPFNQRIGCQRRSVNQQLNLGSRSACLIQDLTHTVDHALLRRVGGGQNFEGGLTGTTPQHHVGKRSADIYGDSTGRFHHLPIPESKHPRCNFQFCKVYSIFARHFAF